MKADWTERSSTCLLCKVHHLRELARIWGQCFSFFGAQRSHWHPSVDAAAASTSFKCSFQMNLTEMLALRGHMTGAIWQSEPASWACTQVQLFLLSCEAHCSTYAWARGQFYDLASCTNVNKCIYAAMQGEASCDYVFQLVFNDWSISMVERNALIVNSVYSQLSCSH